MIELFNTAINSPIIIVITILYAITSAITTFDIRMTQAKRNGILRWTGLSRHGNLV